MSRWRRGEARPLVRGGAGGACRRALRGLEPRARVGGVLAAAGALDAPLYLVVLLAFALGFLFGELVAWLNAGRTRRQARERMRRIAALERELAATQANLAPPQPQRPASASLVRTDERR